jgi:hypothetical protein
VNLKVDYLAAETKSSEKAVRCRALICDLVTNRVSGQVGVIEIRLFRKGTCGGILHRL